MGIDIDDNEKTEGSEGGGVGVLRLSMSSIRATRRSITKVIDAYNHDKLGATKSRNLTWMLSVLIAAFRTEKELDFEKRLDELEKRLAGDGE